MAVYLFHKFFGHNGVSAGRDTGTRQYRHCCPWFNLNILFVSCGHTTQEPRSDRFFGSCIGYLTG